MIKYLIHLIFISILSIQIVELIKCQSKIVDRQNDDKLRTIYSKCLRNHSAANTDTKSNDKIEFEVDSYDYASDDDDYEEGHNSKDYRGYTDRTGRNGKEIIRVRRQNQPQRRLGKNTNSNSKNHTNGGNGGNESTFNTQCLVYCVFQETGLVNHNQLPDKNKVIHFMLTNVNDMEFRDFVIDSVGECFHYIEYNHVQDKCDFAKNLGDCLTERASVNCDHWDKKNILFS